MIRLVALSALVSLAAAAQPVVLYEAKVAQYREAAAAAKRVLGDVKELDPDDGELSAALGSAPVVVAIGQKALSVAKQKAGQTPVVFCMVLGVTKSTIGPSVTGVPLEPDPTVTLAHIRQAVQAAKKVGLVYNPASLELFAAEAQRSAAAAGLSLVLKPVSSPAEVKDAVSSLMGSVDVVWLPPDPRLFPREVFSSVLATTAERKVPVFAFLFSLTEAGALASAHADYADAGERAGKLALELASRPEAKRLPVPPPVYAPGVLTINLKTARALGIEVSSKAMSDAKQFTR